MFGERDAHHSVSNCIVAAGREWSKYLIGTNTVDIELRGFAGWQNYVVDDAPQYKSRYDLHVLHTNDYFYFNGPAAKAAYGGPVPLMLWYGTHLGNNDPRPGQDLTSDVMHLYLPYGSRVFVSPIDIAILSVCMVPVRSLVPAQLQAYPQGTFTFSTEVGRTYDVQVSSNLTTWATIQRVMSTNAVMSVMDDGTSGANRRFYRVVAP